MDYKYDEVPVIITGKDLDYLTDLFNWNYGAVKSANEAMVSVTDKELKDLLSEVKQVHLNNLNIITDLLDEKGRLYE